MSQLQIRRVEVSGDLIHGQSPLALPNHRCVRCGSTEQGGAMHNERLNYVNPLIWLTFLISGLITIMAYLFTRKPVQVQYYLCPACEDRRRIARLTTSLVATGSMVGMVATITGGPFETFLIAFFIAIMGRLFWARSPLHPVAHNDGTFALKGASQKFLAEHRNIDPSRFLENQKLR